MSSYRRLISYIYAYEGKKKGKNIGFVKLEAKEGQCKLGLNVKKVYVEGNDMGVYLLGKDGQETFLSNVFIRNGCGEFRTVVDAKNVMGTGNSLDTYCGLTIHDVKNSWRSYTTIWEDSVSHMAQEELPGAQDKSVPQDQVVSKVVKEIESEIAKEENRKSDEENVRTRAAEIGTSAFVQVPETAEKVIVDFSRKKPNQPKPEMPPSPQPGPGSRPNPGPRPGSYSGQFPPIFLSRMMAAHTDMNANSVPGQSETIQPETVQSGAGGTNLPETYRSLPQSEAQPQSETQTEPEPQNRTVQEPEVMVSPELENPEVLKYLQETEELAQDAEKLWEELRKSYPKIQPFDYDDGCEILTIRPQDIGRLPREIWVYGNNSFLLHGYYNFRYLILVRLGNSKGNPRYLLGVPGHYYSNEKYMASMFGFPNFVLSKKQPSNDGRFGYWYTDIKMG